MSKIESFLNKKNKEQYEFKIIASDGEHIIQTNCLQEFTNDWMNGKLEKGRMVTHDGRVIYANNNYTEKAVKEKIIIDFNIEGFDITNESLIVLKDTMGLNIKDVACLLMNINDKETKSYIETPLGHAFLIMEDNPLYSNFVHSDSFLKKINMPEGSMSLEDVVVMKDNINKLTLILDTRKEAVELEDMVSRSLTKNKTLNVVEHYIDDMGINNDISVIDTNIFAQDSKIDLIKVKLNKLINVCEHTGNGFDFYENGFNNSKDSPISKYDFYNTTKEISRRVIDTNQPAELSESTKILQKEYGLFKNTEIQNEQFNALLVNKELIARAGSKNKTFFLETEDGVQEIKEGMLLKIAYQTPIEENYKVVTQEEMKNFTDVTNNIKKNRIPF